MFGVLDCTSAKFQSKKLQNTRLIGKDMTNLKKQRGFSTYDTGWLKCRANCIETTIRIRIAWLFDHPVYETHPEDQEGCTTCLRSIVVADMEMTIESIREKFLRTDTGSGGKSAVWDDGSTLGVLEIAFGDCTTKFYADRLLKDFGMNYNRREITFTYVLFYQRMLRWRYKCDGTHTRERINSWYELVGSENDNIFNDKTLYY